MREQGEPGRLPLRGEVWDAHFPPPVGLHPVVILTSNALIPRLQAVSAAIVTGTPGPPTTHVVLGGVLRATERVFHCLLHPTCKRRPRSCLNIPGRETLLKSL